MYVCIHMQYGCVYIIYDMYLYTRTYTTCIEHKFVRFFRVNHWIPAKRPNVYQTSEVKLIAKEEPNPTRVKLLFKVKGSDHMSIYFSPWTNAEIVDWSFDKDKIIPSHSDWKDGRKVYHIFYSHGLNPGPWEFWVELKVINK